MDNSKGSHLSRRIGGAKETPLGVESEGHRSEAALRALLEVRSLCNEFVARCGLAPSHGQLSIPWNAVRPNGEAERSSDKIMTALNDSVSAWRITVP